MSGVLVGALLAVGIAAVGRWTRMDEERSFYAVILACIASYWIVFAAVEEDVVALAVEAGVAAVFLVLAGLGARWSPWAVVAGLALHAGYDGVHAFISDVGPDWWPLFCAVVDALLAGWVGWRWTRAGQ